MRFQCPQCKGIIAAEDTDMGTTVQCGHCTQEVTVPESRTASGSVIGEFIILRELGRGGMGIVYLAHQISLDRPAALKILSENYASNAEFVVGFIKEARAAAKLNHPNIVQAYAVGDDDGIFYFAMEHINGETMKMILAQERSISLEKSLDIIEQIAEALEYAWQEEKLVHRDIKPDNIMLTSNGRAKLADLGLAKVGDDNGAAEGDEVMGTPQYISPEQLTGDALDNRTDIYSLGATFYQFVTGRFPYEGNNAQEISRQHLFGTLVPPAEVNPEIPVEVSNIIVRMMEKEPQNRYQTAAELAEDIAKLKQKRKNGDAPAATAKAKPKLSLKGAAQPQPQTQPQEAQQTEQKFNDTKTVQENPSSAETAQKAAPKLSIKPKILSLPQKPEPPKPAAPPAEQSATPKPVTPKPAEPEKKKTAKGAGKMKVSGKDVADTKNKGKKPVYEINQAKTRTKNIILGIILVILLAAGGTGAYFHFVKKVDLQEFAKETMGKLQESAKPAELSAFMKEAQPVMEAINTRGTTETDSVLRQCASFLQKNPQPETDEEKNIMQQIVEYYAEKDEDQIENARIEAIQQYNDEQERKKQQALIAEQKRIAEAKKRQEEEANRRIRQAEQQQRNAEAARIRNQYAAMRNRVILDIVNYAERNDGEGFRKAMENYAAEVEKAQPQHVALARPVAAKAKQIAKIMEPVWECEKIFKEGDPRLNGLNIEIGLNFCKVKDIKNNTIYAETMSGKQMQVKITDKLMKTRQFQIFLNNMSEKLDLKNKLPYYYFWKGNYLQAQQLLQNCTRQEQNKYSTFVIEYLRVAMAQNAAVKAKTTRKFGQTNEYKRLYPSRRRR